MLERVTEEEKEQISGSSGQIRITINGVLQEDKKDSTLIPESPPLHFRGGPVSASISQEGELLRKPITKTRTQLTFREDQPIISTLDPVKNAFKQTWQNHNALKLQISQE